MFGASVFVCLERTFWKFIERNGRNCCANCIFNGYGLFSRDSRNTCLEFIYVIYNNFINMNMLRI